MIFGNPDKFAIYVDIVNDWHVHQSDIEGITGLYINGRLVISNYALIALHTEIESMLDFSVKNLKDIECFHVLSDEDKARHLLSLRHPDWCAQSALEFNQKNFQDKIEVFDFDASFESFSVGHMCRLYLFIIKKNAHAEVIFIKHDVNPESPDFIDLQNITRNNISSSIISIEELSNIYDGIMEFHSKYF